MAVPFIFSTPSCCCKNQINNWKIITDAQSISEIKNAPDYVYRGTLQCSALKQNTISQKNMISGNIRGTVRERAKDGDGVKTNYGSGRGTDSQYSSLNLECTCSGSGPYFSLNMRGGLNGAYRYSNGTVQPYTNVPFSLTVPNIVFLCDGAGTSMEIWSEYAYGDNVSEDPEEEFSVAGLISQGSINLTIFGQSMTINLPYNTWDPDWASDENFSGSYTANATITLTRQDC